MSVGFVYSYDVRDSAANNGFYAVIPPHVSGLYLLLMSYCWYAHGPVTTTTTTVCTGSCTDTHKYPLFCSSVDDECRCAMLFSTVVVICLTLLLYHLLSTK